MTSAPSIAFDVRPSPVLVLASRCGVVLAAIAPWQSALPAGFRSIASLAALLLGAWALRRFLRPHFERVAYGAIGWSLSIANVEPKCAELIVHRRLGAWLALDFRTADGNRFRVVLGPDNCDVDTRRRLALMLARTEISQPGSES